MPQLYVLGGRQRNLIIKPEEEWNLYESAVILRLDIDSGAVHTCVEHRTRDEARAQAHSSSVFKSGTLRQGTLYTCTNTEILVFSMPDFRLTKYLSLPFFNDLHHVLPSKDDTLLVVSTGLDMVARLSPEGELLEGWDVLGHPLWQRFARDIDYRKVESTKPHASHPNFVFELDGQVWVTRFIQRDAVCLTDPNRKINIELESPHDGLVRGSNIYFTLVDGQLVIANTRTLAVDRVIDFKSFNQPSALLGWCRGVLPVNDTRVWIGFTRVRKTRIRENVLWVKRVFKEGMLEKATHLALYDIESKEVLREFDLEAHGMNIVFSIFPA